MTEYEKQAKLEELRIDSVLYTRAARDARMVGLYASADNYERLAKDAYDAYHKLKAG